MPPLVGDLIDANGREFRSFAIGQPPLHSMANAAVDPIPTGAKDLRNFAPVHATRPRRKEPFVGSGHLFFAAGPRELFGFDATAVFTVHPPHRIKEEHL